MGGERAAAARAARSGGGGAPTASTPQTARWRGPGWRCGCGWSGGAGCRPSRAPAQQHRARRRLKRLRYLLAFSAAPWPVDAVQALRPRLSAAQDALGLHLVVGLAAAALQAASARRPDAARAAAWLQAHRARTAHDAQHALRALLELRCPWPGPTRAH